MSRSKQNSLSSSALQQALPPLSPGTVVWVAYSGGCDSHVLLHALAQLRQEQSFNMNAVYVNHGLSPKAAEWGQHCQAVCNELDVKFVCLEVDATPGEEESPEEAARRARYQAIIELLQPGDYLCTAHHQDDQAETLLLQLLRGAGPKGLAGMPASSALGAATQLRPLLGFSQAQLLAYAEQHQLNWIEDESNSDTGINRNYLRHEIMPRLRQRWPSADATLSRSASHCAEAAQLMKMLASQDYQLVKSESSTEINIKKLLELDPARQKNLLRYWVHQAQLPLPSEKKLQHIMSDVLHAAADKTPCVKWPGAEVRRFDGRLYVMSPMPEFDTMQIIPWDDLDQPLQLPDGRQLICKPCEAAPALSLERLNQGQVTVRFRQGGEVCKPAGSAHHKSLKQIFQEKRMPPWLREHVPLLYVDDQLVALIGVCLTDVMIATGAETAIIPKLVGVLVNSYELSCQTY